MAARPRLDVELVRRGLAPSREQAQVLISQGRVLVNGVVAAKAASQVESQTSIAIKDAAGSEEFASRGGHKLAGALGVFPVVVAGKRCLDAGASTGGFTDVLLRAGAREVVAVDVGYGQLVWALQQDERVKVFDRTNVRHLTTDLIGGPVDLIVADLSFISLSLVLPALTDVAPEGEMLLMVKPQFEVGKERLGAGGVVRESSLRVEAVASVARSATRLGWRMSGVVASPLPGPAGNVEYFLWLQRSERALDSAEVDVSAIAQAVAEGPQ